MLLRSLPVYILKQLFFSISGNSGRIFTSISKNNCLNRRLVNEHKFYNSKTVRRFEPMLCFESNEIICALVRLRCFGKYWLMK